MMEVVTEVTSNYSGQVTTRLQLTISSNYYGGARSAPRSYYFGHNPTRGTFRVRFRRPRRFTSTWARQNRRATLRAAAHVLPLATSAASAGEVRE